MALVNEMMGSSSVMDKSSFLDPSRGRRVFVLRKNLPFQGRKLQPKGLKNTLTIVAAISEDLELVKVVPDKAVKFKVGAVVTVRNKHKEDFKETFVKHLDAFTDKIGRNVVLELISNDIDPSKFLLPFSSFFI